LDVTLRNTTTVLCVTAQLTDAFSVVHRLDTDVVFGRGNPCAELEASAHTLISRNIARVCAEASAHGLSKPLTTSGYTA